VISGALRWRKIAMLVLRAHRVVELLRPGGLRLRAMTAGEAKSSERRQKVPNS
jgi:hypothetical protein